jgi:hypothetical protein
MQTVARGEATMRLLAALLLAAVYEGMTVGAALGRAAEIVAAPSTCIR